MDNKQLTLVSLFTGSGGFELGGILAGIQQIWQISTAEKESAYY